MMELDPQVRALLKLFEGRPAANTLPVEVARKGFSKSIADLVPRPPEPVGVDRIIEGPGGPLPVRIYRPSKAGSARLPLILFFHGGGWVVCDLDTHDATARRLSSGAQAVVVSVDYRMAPEHCFPAAPDDCVAATRWAMAHADELGIDAARTVVAGDSAGGNLAAAVALRLRDDGAPKLAGQLLLYPVTAHYTAAFESYAEFASGYGLTRDMMVWFWDLYLGRSLDAQAASALSPQAAPLLSQNLAGLPPTLLMTAAVDVLRDEGEAYGMRLRDAGVELTMHRCAGMHHGFFNYGGVLDGADRAMVQACEWISSLRPAPGARAG
jgi:acetyl esterase